MNDLLSKSIHDEYGFSIYENKEIKRYIYLDDGIFTGNKVLNDLSLWITHDTTPVDAEIYIIVIFTHNGGKYYAEDNLKKRLAQANKEGIKIKWWSFIKIEDRRAYVNISDVLRPIAIPNDSLTKKYVAEMEYKQELRTPGYNSNNSYYSSEEGRHLLEQEFLKAGVRIRSMCPNLNKYQRPLGNMVLDTLGFGSLTVTHRNCPNNSPLVFWAGDPWYPLFPRKVN